MILAQLGTRNRVDVTELTRLFGVSEMTVRRDLAELQHEGLLRRVHGGAVRLDRSPFEIRDEQLPAEKTRIAKKAAALIDDGDTVAIDIGTTAHYVARELRHRTGLLIITNSIKIAAEFRNTPNKVLVPGGMMLPELSLVGPITTEALRRLHAAKAILGCGGLTLTHGLSYFDINETEVRRTMIDISDESIVVADHTKFGRTETVSLGPPDMVDVIITDREPAGEFRPVFADGDVELIVA
ncbi:MAG TPA: DeoR/GlpR family DNA-binding transcription regulator [Trebonia sp.]|nr:DeoR/GlpR family DNA-binding transcription regulator [Trebonia sp.]